MSVSPEFDFLGDIDDSPEYDFLGIDDAPVAEQDAGEEFDFLGIDDVVMEEPEPSALVAAPAGDLVPHGGHHVLKERIISRLPHRSRQSDDEKKSWSHQMHRQKKLVKA